MYFILMKSYFGINVAGQYRFFYLLGITQQSSRIRLFVSVWIDCAFRETFTLYIGTQVIWEMHELGTQQIIYKWVFYCWDSKLDIKRNRYFQGNPSLNAFENRETQVKELFAFNTDKLVLFVQLVYTAQIKITAECRSRI